MKKTDLKVVANLYKDGGADDNPTNLELTYRDEYIVSNESDDMNYFQFGMNLPDGTYLEVRLDLETIQTLYQSIEGGSEPERDMDGTRFHASE